MTTHAEMARDHLWMHFARPGGDPTMIVTRGEGCWIWDDEGNKYLDALAGLFVTQIGHGRSELGNAAGKQAEQLGFFPEWGAAHQPAAELAARLADLAPGDMDRVFFTTGGSEAVESAWKLARQYHVLRGDTERTKVISRNTSYHGTTLGALAITGIPRFKTPFEPMLSSLTTHVANTHEAGLAAADAIEDAIVAAGPETVAAVYLEPVQNSGGCFVPPPGYWQRVREICDRHGVLLVSDEVICGFGRLGTWFGGHKFDYVPDMITFAKGVTSGYLPLGGVITRKGLMDPFVDAEGPLNHGITFGGHPVSCAVALANIDILEGEGIIENVASNEDYFRAGLETLLDIPIAAEVRGTGYFYAIGLMRDSDAGVEFEREEALDLVSSVMTPAMKRHEMLARADARGAPILQFSPPLIATRQDIDFMVEKSRAVLEEAASALG